MERSVVNELNELLNAFGATGADKRIFEDKDIAHLAASGHKILSMRDIEGLEVMPKKYRKEVHRRFMTALEQNAYADARQMLMHPSSPEGPWRPKKDPLLDLSH